MNPGIIVGRVVATQKYHTLTGLKMLLVQPTDWHRNPKGDALVAIDLVGAGSAEFVFYVSAREAAFAAPEVPPVDAAVMGIIDEVDLPDERQ